MNVTRILCDICQKYPWTRFGIVCGIETNYCVVCAGGTPEENRQEWLDSQDVHTDEPERYEDPREAYADAVGISSRGEL